MDRRKYSFKSVLLRVLGTLFVLYVLIGFVCWLQLDSMMFHPQDTVFPEQLKEQLFELEWNGEKISCLHLKNENASKTILYSHGNAEDIASRNWIFQEYVKNGFSVMAYDYPGYGFSSGRPTEAGVYGAADAAYLYLTEKLGIRPADIVVYGRSIGSGPSHYLAEKYPVGGLVIECGFTSIVRVGVHYPIFPFDAFPNINRIRNIHCPVLYFHGEQDTTVPFWHGEKMYSLANEPKQCLWIPNCGHSNIIQTVPEDYWKTLKDFINNLDTINKE